MLSEYAFSGPCVVERDRSGRRDALKNGGPYRNRTYNQWIKSPLLCLVELTAPRFFIAWRRWGGRWDSNPRRPGPQPGALPTELRPPLGHYKHSMARPAGLEPATLGLEGRCSIRLSYGRYVECLGSLLTPIVVTELVGADGFEPPTLCSQSRCATRLRHAPTDTTAPS